LKNTELDNISPHTRKSILTSTNPTTHLLDLRRNVFRPLLLAGTKLKSTYKSLELTTATRFPQSSTVLLLCSITSYIKNTIKRQQRPNTRSINRVVNQ